jgi:hypothetical protein
MAKIKPEVFQTQLQSEEQNTRENASSGQRQVLQQIVPSENRTIQKTESCYPSWPTSKPGPQSTQPTPGTRSINSFRPEQAAEIGYNQETAEPSIDSSQYSTSDASIHDLANIDQPRNAQEILGKRKERL